MALEGFNAAIQRQVANRTATNKRLAETISQGMFSFSDGAFGSRSQASLEQEKQGVVASVQQSIAAAMQSGDDNAVFEAIKRGSLKLQTVDPGAAKQLMDWYTQFQPSAPEERKIILQGGIQYYADTGLPVLNVPTQEGDPDANKIILKDYIQKYGNVEGAFKYKQYLTGLSQAIVKAEGTGTSPELVSKLFTSFRAETNKYVDRIDTAQEVLVALQEGSGVSVNQVERMLIKLVGDSNISMGEVAGIAKAGSLTERIAGTLEKWIAGTFTEAKEADIRSLVNAISINAQERFNEQREGYHGAYEIAGMPIELLNFITGDKYEFGITVDTATVEDIIALQNLRNNEVK